VTNESDPRDRVSVFDERQSLHLYAPGVHRALVAVGLIWREGDRWRMDSTRVDLGAMPELALCDFCNEQPVTWDVQADDFTLDVPGLPRVRSANNWLACEPCGVCIHAGDRPGLQARVVTVRLAQDIDARPRGVRRRADRLAARLLAALSRHHALRHALPLKE
jgi:hypothetical protein